MYFENYYIEITRMMFKMDFTLRGSVLSFLANKFQPEFKTGEYTVVRNTVELLSHLGSLSSFGGTRSVVTVQGEILKLVPVVNYVTTTKRLTRLPLRIPLQSTNQRVYLFL